jgi:tetratricopeptide (TPR) repeat protein
MIDCPSNSIISKPRNAILILLIFSLGLYYKTLNAELLSLDDKGLVYSYNNGNTDIKNFFFPQETHSYYRPVIQLSFLIDYLIWMDHESGFHLTNIILHSANVLLVYILCQFILKLQVPGSRFQVKTMNMEHYIIAFFAALIFAIHPINTEAVNFISARTDILATFFVLISFLLFLYYKNPSLIPRLSSLVFLFLSVLTYLLAILSKEVALTLPLIIIAYEYFSSRRFKTILGLSIFFALPVIIYFYLRPLGVSEADIGIGKTMGITDRISTGLFVDFAAAVGFYFKKLIYPFPLNFAIVEINKGFYFIVGAIFLASLLILGLIVSKNSAARIKNIANNRNLLPTAYYLLPTFCLWSIFLFFLPSIAISLTDIAWTPYAERYLYLPSVFFCILFSFQLSSLVPRPSSFVPHPSSLVIMIAIALLFSIATYNRNTIWLSNLTLWEDTVKKSPTFGKAHNEYGVALKIKGENELAKEQFLKAKGPEHETNPLFNLGGIAMRNNDFELAKKYFTEGVKITPDIKAYKMLAYIYLEKGTEDNKDYLSKAIEYIEKAYRMDRGDEILALKLAGLYCRVNRYEDAKVALQKVINDNPDSYIEKSAKKMLDKIEKKEYTISTN